MNYKAQFADCASELRQKKIIATERSELSRVILSDVKSGIANAT
jgi:hypothetical protein